MKKLSFPFIILWSESLALAQNVSIGHTTPLAKLDIRGVASSPTLPGTTSTGILRIGISSDAGIDFGKMDSPPFIGWIQAGHTGVDDTGVESTLPSPLSLQPVGGNVGIGTGTSSPGGKLHVNGTIKVTDGTQGAGKILTSDASGLASWQPPPPPPPTYYPSVGICCQSWMTKNLDVTTYRNGDPIPKVTDNLEWSSLTNGAYCYYNNDSSTYAATYGKLYNWFAVNDSRGLAPEGWHIPTDFEWTTLGNCLSGDTIAGGPMKESGTTHWNTPNTGATNLSGFTGLPGGHREHLGDFSNIGQSGRWWSSTQYYIYDPWYRQIDFTGVHLSSYTTNPHWGFSVRCLRD